MTEPTVNISMEDYEDFKRVKSVFQSVFDYCYEGKTVIIGPKKDHIDHVSVNLDGIEYEIWDGNQLFTVLDCHIY